MLKEYRIIMAVLLGLCCMSTSADCDTAASVEGAINSLNHFIADHPLTENDKAGIGTIVNARLEGIMLKIAPNFSENGSATYNYIRTQSECLGGFGSFKGIAYGIEVLRIIKN